MDDIKIGEKYLVNSNSSYVQGKGTSPLTVGDIVLVIRKEWSYLCCHLVEEGEEKDTELYLYARYLDEYKDNGNKPAVKKGLELDDIKIGETYIINSDYTTIPKSLKVFKVGERVVVRDKYHNVSGFENTVSCCSIKRGYIYTTLPKFLSKESDTPPTTSIKYADINVGETYMVNVDSPNSSYLRSGDIVIILDKRVNSIRCRLAKEHKDNAIDRYTSCHRDAFIFAKHLSIRTDDSKEIIVASRKPSVPKGYKKPRFMLFNDERIRVEGTILPLPIQPDVETNIFCKKCRIRFTIACNNCVGGNSKSRIPTEFCIVRIFDLRHNDEKIRSNEEWLDYIQPFPSYDPLCDKCAVRKTVECNPCMWRPNKHTHFSDVPLEKKTGLIRPFITDKYKDDKKKNVTSIKTPSLNKKVQKKLDEITGQSDIKDKENNNMIVEIVKTELKPPLTLKDGFEVVRILENKDNRKPIFIGIGHSENIKKLEDMFKDNKSPNLSTNSDILSFHKDNVKVLITDTRNFYNLTGDPEIEGVKVLEDVFQALVESQDPSLVSDDNLLDDCCKACGQVLEYAQAEYCKECKSVSSLNKGKKALRRSEGL